MEVIGIDESRSVEVIKGDGGCFKDLIPGTIKRWIVVSGKPSGQTFRAEVSNEDWEKFIVPLLTV